ncbi:MAG: hypothetical protein JWN49_704 [Parcubacteria group bacterium]|nr:hypothetical protein [Parcubacteria group bacterium]
MNTLSQTETTEKLLNALDMQGLPVEQQEELLLDLNDMIFKGSLIRLIERMDDQTKDSFNELLETDPEEEVIEAFLAAHVPDADLAVQETLDELTSDILAATGPVTS